MNSFGCAINENRKHLAPSSSFINRIWQYLIISAYVIFIFGLAIKPNKFELHGLGAQLPDIIYRISSTSIYLYLYGISVFFIFLVKAKGVGCKRVPPALIMFTFFYIYMVVRLFFDGFSTEKVIAGFFGQIIIALFLIGYYRDGKFLAQRIEDFILALSVWALLYTLMTFGSLLAGYGYSHGDTIRFFGITSHPNTAGFHLAISTISLLDFLVRRAKGYFLHITYGTTFLLAIYLCALTGSRTSMSMCVLSIFLYSYLAFGNSRNSKNYVILIFSTLTAFFLFLLTTNVFAGNDFINRMFFSGDSRSEAWQSMLDVVMSNPWLGMGMEVLVIGSESSYLKALAISGLIFGMLFIGSVLSSAYYAFTMLSFKKILQSKISSLPLFITLLFALMWSGMLEGTLVEMASLGAFLFLLASHIIYCGYKNSLRENKFFIVNRKVNSKPSAARLLVTLRGNGL